MLERGKHQQAARLFQELASRAEDRQIPQAPLLYLQAGRAYVLGNDLVMGRQQIFKAFELLAAAGAAHRLGSVSRRLITELTRLGHRQLASDLQTRLDQLKPANEPDQPPMPPDRSLPAKCEQCGATLHPAEVEVLTDSSFACAYCGSRVMMGAG